MEVIAARTMNALYMYLDVAFLLFLGATLVYTKRYLAIIVGLLAGILYFIVDYGYFYLYLGTRSVEGADPFCFLLWLSMSYGFTNFVWIWLWLDRDKRALEWSILIIASWFTTSLLSQSFGGNFAPIAISRGTEPTMVSWPSSSSSDMLFFVFITSERRTKPERLTYRGFLPSGF